MSVGDSLEAVLMEVRERLARIEAVAARPATVAVTMEQAAAMLSCSARHISGLVRSGSLRTCEVGSLRRIPVAEIHALLAAPAMKSSGATPERTRYDGAAALARLAALRKRR